MSFSINNYPNPSFYLMVIIIIIIIIIVIIIVIIAFVNMFQAISSETYFLSLMMDYLKGCLIMDSNMYLIDLTISELIVSNSIAISIAMIPHCYLTTVISI